MLKYLPNGLGKEVENRDFVFNLNDMELEKPVETLKIDLGCGPNKKAGFKGMDILPLPGVDFVVDLEKGFGFIEDNSVDEFYTSHFLEHVQNLELILSEIYRTLKPRGTLTVFVPHFSNP